MKIIIKYLVLTFFITVVSCDTNQSPTIWRAQNCNLTDCDSDDDGNCCETPECRETFCSNNNEARAYLRVGPGRICGIIQGCLPPVDIRDLLILVFSSNPKEASYVFETVKNNEVFAKSDFQKFDEKSGIVTFSNEIVNEGLTEEELVLSILTSYTDEQGQVQSLKMKTDVFPAGFFSQTK